MADAGALNVPMVKVGASGLYAVAVNLSHGAALTWHYELGPDRRLGGSQIETYETPPDSRERSDVPKGTVKQMPPWQSKIFEGTKRDWWVYVPAQYRPASPAAVMVFQDGAGPKDYVPTVFDNLIAKGDMPVMVGIFINPGTRADGGSNRSFEYDTLSDQYARFLLEEILPEVEKTVKLRHDAASRAISGASSGGICSFTVAWERPNEFRKVLSWVGSFTNIASGKTMREGGHNYEALIRKTSRGSRSACSCRMAKTIWTTPTATGRWPIRRWPSHWPMRATTTSSNTAMDSTAIAMAARSCRTRCGGCGGITSRNESLLAVAARGSPNRLNSPGRAVTSISISIRGSASPAAIMVAAGLMSPRYLRNTGQHFLNCAPSGRMYLTRTTSSSLAPASSSAAAMLRKHCSVCSTISSEIVIFA